MTTRGKVITGILIVAVAIVAFYALFPFLIYFLGPYQAERMVVRALSKTDHQALLKAGREVLRQMPKMQNKTPSVSGLFVAIPEEIPLPQALRDLSAHYIEVNSYGYMRIEMHGAMTHFGFRIYPEDFNAPADTGFKFEYGDRKIIDGLWYYDDGYHYPDGSSFPDYAKKVDALLKQNKYRK